ncbi:hypothetical protein ALC57_05702 [Trachymyrmex cornetzi]|uniref:Uncharacterized protein n=1 Tax=Trachymyrmex cornetzi TaxID=471704 RepID=A0A151JA74_9HYME|nr:hypothetical protein ALC57_05702 [Trachymyrmex cornetzi]
MRVRRGFLPQPPQGAPWRLAAVREDDIAHRRGTEGRAATGGPSTGCRTRSRSGDPTGIQEGTRSLDWILVANLRAIEFASYSYSLDEYGKFNHFQDADFESAYHDAFESPDKSGWARDISKFALGRSEIFHLKKLCLNFTFVIMLRFSLLLSQSHATVIPRYIQERRVKQD